MNLLLFLLISLSFLILASLKQTSLPEFLVACPSPKPYLGMPTMFMKPKTGTYEMKSKKNLHLMVFIEIRN